jgi:DNA-binding CsgD family transcriptional regulator/PAS domain-containing protein
MSSPERVKLSLLRKEPRFTVKGVARLWHLPSQVDMSLNLKDLSPVLEALYEAPIDPSRWEKFLQLTARVVGGEAAALLLHDFGDSQSRVARHWSLASQTSQTAQSEEEQRSGLEAWIQAVTRASEKFGTLEPVIAFADLEGTEFYHDLLLPFGMPHGIFGMVERGAARVASLSIYRGGKAGEFREQDFEVVRFLCPHIERAYRLHLHLAGSRKQRASLRSALDSLSMGVILVASRGQVVTMNRAAEQLLADNDSLQASPQGLRAESAGEAAQLDRLIEEATGNSEAEFRSAGLLTISRKNRSALLLLVSRVRSLDVDQAHPVRAIVFISDPEQKVRPTCDTLRALFGLTPAEYRLAMLLADGHDPVAIAELVGVSRNTLKSQLTSIYRKTGTSRQAQLVRLLLQLPSTSSPVAS